MRTIVPVWIMLTAFASLGCGPTVTEHAGAATYEVDNQSDLTLQAVFQLTEGLGADTVTSATIEPGTRTMVQEDSCIGMNPWPSFTMAWFSLQRADDGTEVYRQDPVDDDEWLTDESPPENEYGISHYRLLVTDADLTL